MCTSFIWGFPLASHLWIDCTYLCSPEAELKQREYLRLAWLHRQQSASADGNETHKWDSPSTTGSPSTCPAFCHQGTPLTTRAAAGVALALGCSTAAISVHLQDHCCKGPTRSALGPPSTHVCPLGTVGAAKQEFTRPGLWKQRQALSKGQRKSLRAFCSLKSPLSLQLCKTRNHDIESRGMRLPGQKIILPDLMARLKVSCISYNCKGVPVIPCKPFSSPNVEKGLWSQLWTWK